MQIQSQFIYAQFEFMFNLITFHLVSSYLYSFLCPFIQPHLIYIQSHLFYIKSHLIYIQFHPIYIELHLVLY